LRLLGNRSKHQQSLKQMAAMLREPGRRASAIAVAGIKVNRGFKLMRSL
jgi:hypothetical protein